MPRRKDDRAVKEAGQWLKRARSNLARARAPIPTGALREDSAYDAQQAAEKAVKAVLTYRQIAFRFVHDLGELLSTAEQNGISMPNETKESVVLTQYAVETRYPGPYEPLGEQELDEAIRVAQCVVNWAESLIKETK